MEEDEDSEILSEISVTSNNSLITNKSGINILVGSATEDIRDIKDDDILPKTKTKRYLRHRHYRVDHREAKLPEHEYSQTSPYLQRRALRLNTSPKLLNIEEPSIELTAVSPKKLKKHKR